MRRLAVAVVQAAEMIGVSESLMWRLVSDGKIQRIKIGRRTVIRTSELERFLSEHEESPAGTRDSSETSTLLAGDSDVQR